jgi:hypothetical protein
MTTAHAFRVTLLTHFIIFISLVGPMVIPVTAQAETAPTHTKTTVTVHRDGEVYRGKLNKKRPPSKESKYWTDVVLIDLVGAGLLALEPAAGFAVMAIGPGLIHDINDNPARGGGSIALRLGLPLMGFGMGGMMGDCHFILCSGGEAEVGAGIGFALAVVTDYVILLSDVQDADYQASLIEHGSLSANPTVGMNPDGDLTLGLTGRF